MTTDISSAIGDAYDKLSTESSLQIETKPEEVKDTTSELDSETQPTKVEDQPPKPAEDQSKDEKGTFTKIDRNSLSEELIPHFEKLNRDYLQAVERHAGRYRSQIAEKDKELETLRQQLAQPKPNETPGANGDQPQNDPQTIKNQVTAELEEQHIAAQEETILSLDTRLVKSDDNPNFDKKLFGSLVYNVEEQAKAHAEKYGSRLNFDYVNAAKEYLKEWDSSMRKETETLVQAKTKEAKAKAESAKLRNPNGTFANGVRATGKMSFEDAFNKANDDLNVTY